jgi:hypothetical protein
MSKSGSESGPPSRAEAEQRARARNRAESLPEDLRSGNSGSAREQLRKLAEEMGKRPGSGSLGDSADRALDDVRRARGEQLSEMNGEGEGEGEGQGQGQGQGEGQGQGQGERQGQGQGEGQGEGQGPGSSPGNGDGPPSMGMTIPGAPSGKPGPGGGDGSDAHGETSELPEASVYAPEHVQTRPKGEAQGAIRIIKRASEGHRDTREYRDLHDKYESIAESAVRREEIPLTRRDYIRNYFQAVRGGN